MSEKQGCAQILREVIIKITQRQTNNCLVPVWLYVLFYLIEMGQCLSFLVSPRYSFTWREDLPYYITYALDLTSLHQFYNDSTLLVLGIALQLISFLAWALIYLFSRFQFFNGKSTLYEIVFLVAGFQMYGFKTVYPLPILGAAVSALYSGQADREFAGYLALLLLLAIVVYYQYCVHDINPFSRIPFAKFGSRIDIFRQLYKIGISFYFVLDSSFKYMSIFLVVNGLISLLLNLANFFSEKIYSKAVQYAQNIAYSLLFWASINSLILHFQKPNQTALFYFFLFQSFFYLFALDFLGNKYRLYQLSRDPAPAEAEFVALRLIEALKGRERFSSQHEMLLILDRHSQSCDREGCPCRGLQLSSSTEEWYKLVLVVIDYGIREGYSDYQLQILKAIVLLECLGNKFSALGCLKYKEGKFSISEEIILVTMRDAIEQRISQQDQTNSLNAFKFMRFNQEYQRFEQQLNETIVNHIRFWAEVADEIPFASKIQKAAERILQSSEALEHMFTVLLQLNCNNYCMLKTYGRYLKLAEGKRKKGQELLQRAQISEKTAATQHFSDFEHLKYGENSDTSIFYVLGNEKSLGVIKNTNQYVDRFGYLKKDLKGQSINTLMPFAFGNRHDEVLLRFMSEYEASSVSSMKSSGLVERNLVLLNPNQHLLPVTIMTKMLPDISEGIVIIAFVKKSDEFLPDENYFLVSKSELKLLALNDKAASLYGLSLQNVHSSASEIHLTKIFGLNPFDHQNIKELESQRGLYVRVQNRKKNNSGKQTSLRALSSSLKLEVAWKRNYFGNSIYLLINRGQREEAKLNYTLFLAKRKEKSMNKLEKLQQQLQEEPEEHGLREFRNKIEEDRPPFILKVLLVAGLIALVLEMGLQITSVYFHVNQNLVFNSSLSQYKPILNSQLYTTENLYNSAYLYYNTTDSAKSEAFFSTYRKMLGEEVKLLRSKEQNNIQSVLVNSFDIIEQHVDPNIKLEAASAYIDYVTVLSLYFQLVTENDSNKQSFLTLYSYLRFNALGQLTNLSVYDPAQMYFQSFSEQLSMAPNMELMLVLKLGVLFGLVLVSIPIILRLINTELAVIQLFMLIRLDRINCIITQRKELLTNADELSTYQYQLGKLFQQKIKNDEDSLHRVIQNQKKGLARNQDSLRKLEANGQSNYLFSDYRYLKIPLVVLVFCSLFAVNFWLFKANADKQTSALEQYRLLENRSILCSKLRAATYDQTYFSFMSFQLDKRLVNQTVRQIYENENRLQNFIQPFEMNEFNLSRAPDCASVKLKAECLSNPLFRELKNAIYYFTQKVVESKEFTNIDRFLEVLLELETELLRLQYGAANSMLQVLMAEGIVVSLAAVVLFLLFRQLVWTSYLSSLKRSVVRAKSMLSLIPIEEFRINKQLNAQVSNSAFLKLFQ